MLNQSRQKSDQQKPVQQEHSHRTDETMLTHPIDWTAVAVALTFLSGCGMVTSEAPISSLAATAPDPSLVGHWRGATTLKGGGLVDLEIVDVEPGIYEITFTTGGRRLITNRTGGDGSVIAHTSRLHGMQFLNVRVADDRASFLTGRPRYVLFRYHALGDGALELWTIPKKTARNFVSRDFVSGKERQDAEGGSISLTASSPDLRQLLREFGPAEIFSERAGRFRRVVEVEKRVMSG